MSLDKTLYQNYPLFGAALIQEMSQHYGTIIDWDIKHQLKHILLMTTKSFL